MNNNEYSKFKPLLQEIQKPWSHCQQLEEEEEIPAIPTVTRLGAGQGRAGRFV